MGNHECIRHDRLNRLDVELISPDREAAGTLDLTNDAVGTPSIVNRGGTRLTGDGIGVAVLDTGIAPHEDLNGRVVAFKDLINGKTKAYDDSGHGNCRTGHFGQYDAQYCRRGIRHERNPPDRRQRHRTA